MSSVRFAKIPLRNACLHFRNRVASGNEYTALMQRYGVNLVLDVGANIGQYSRNLIRNGYQGRIVSFEPLADAYQKLQESRWGFPDWQVEPFALGSENTVQQLNIAGNSMSSSLQGMLPNHVEAAPESAYVDTCEVQVRRLESVFDDYVREGDRCYMKLDVQGHEHHVLEGAGNCLDKITAIQMELSMEPLYEGQEVWQQSIEAMESLGFQMILLSPGFCDQRTGVMLQADGIFVRHEAIEQLKHAA
ncbi:MAG: FkbM family methyltransferase [Rubripirellula sp.]